jgi:hypothetical protein
MVDEEKNTYLFESLGLPPLRMVLVQAENERQNKVARTILESPKATEKRRTERAVARLIEHISKTI